MHQTTDTTTRQRNRQARHMRDALKRLEEQADRDAGGIPRAPVMVHRSAVKYNRKAIKREDAKGWD